MDYLTISMPNFEIKMKGNSPSKRRSYNTISAKTGTLRFGNNRIFLSDLRSPRASMTQCPVRCHQKMMKDFQNWNGECQSPMERVQVMPTEMYLRWNGTWTMCSPASCDWRRQIVTLQVYSIFNTAQYILMLYWMRAKDESFFCVGQLKPTFHKLRFDTKHDD
jgi:hypothetical protein